MPPRKPVFAIAPIWGGETIRWYEVLYSGLRWALALLVFFPCVSSWFLLTYLIAPRRLDPLGKWIARAVIRAAGVRVVLEGAPPADGTTRLYIGNHVNIFDVFLYYSCIPGFVRGVELDDHFRWFIYGRVITRLGNIPLSQRNPRAALASLARARDFLIRGTSLIILPEGQRTLTGDFMDFKAGAFRLAQGGQIPVVPVFMSGAWNIARRGSLFTRPGTVRLCFGDAISAESYSGQSANQLRDRVLLAMKALRDGSASGTAGASDRIGRGPQAG